MLVNLAMAGWRTVSRVDASGPYERPVSCGSPRDPVPHPGAPFGVLDEDGVERYLCDRRLEQARTERTLYLSVAGAFGALVGIGALAGSRTGRRAADAGLPLPDLDGATGDRVALRRARPQDALPFTRLVDDVVIERNGWSEETVPTLALLMARDQPDWAWHQDYLIERVDDGVPIGALSVTATAELVVRIGWWIADGHRRQGHATDAVQTAGRALRAAGRGKVGFATAEDNTAIQSIAARIGAREVERAEQALPDGSTPMGIVYLWTPGGAEPDEATPED